MSATTWNDTTMGERIRVLVADDHLLFAESLTIMLEVEPRIEVVGYAADGREAVALGATLCPDVVVMDLDMPLMDGIEATVGLRRSAPGARVVIVTGSRDERDAERAFEAGAAAYVSKDASVEELRELVCEAGNRAVSQGRPHRHLLRSA